VGVGDKAGNFYALDRATGANVWSRALTPGGPNGGVMASAAYHDGSIYVASNDGTSGGTEGAGFGPKAGRIFALNVKDGASRWEVPTTPGTFGGLAYANGVVFVPTLDGKLHAFDAANGTEVWSVTVGEPIGGGVTVSGGMVFVGHGWAWLPSPAMPGGVVAYGLP
jgi:polyvinyl alcohol dehydrogenase (cytochrome)